MTGPETQRNILAEVSSELDRLREALAAARAHRDAWEERSKRAEVDAAILAIPARWLLHLRDVTPGLREQISLDTAEAVRAVLARVEQR